MLQNNSRYHLRKNQAQPLANVSKVLPEMKETLGELIQRRMKDVGIPSKAELARRLGISSAYAGDLANDTGKTKEGTYMPSPELTSKLIEVLKVSENEVLSAIGYAEKTNGSSVPKPILEAIGSEGVLSDNDTVLVANFIKMLKQNGNKKDE